jgi:hypothetical protein
MIFLIEKIGWLGVEKLFEKTKPATYFSLSEDGKN